MATLNKKRPYPPATVAWKSKRKGTEKFVDLSCRRWKSFTNLGTWVVRDMRGKPGVMSVHATGRALDLGYTARAEADNAIGWFTAHNTALGITLINDYQYGKYGRTWICDRQAWKIHDKPTIGARGNWFHVELEPWAADDPVAIERVWRSLPR